MAADANWEDLSLLKILFPCHEIAIGCYNGEVCKRIVIGQYEDHCPMMIDLTTFFVGGAFSQQLKFSLFYFSLSVFFIILGEKVLSPNLFRVLGWSSSTSKKLFVWRGDPFYRYYGVKNTENGAIGRSTRFHRVHTVHILLQDLPQILHTLFTWSD